MVLHCVTHATQHPHPLPPLPEGEGKRGRHSPGVPLAVDALGNISTASGAVCDNADCAKQILPETLQVYQHTLPALVPPAGLQAEAQAGGRIALSWERVAEAEAYQLYCGTTADTLTTCGSPVTTAATTDQPGSDGVYYYAVASLRAANGDTAESGLSAVVSATADAAPPETPDGVAVEQRVEGMYITWTGPIYSEEVAYTLYRATSSDVSDLTEVSGVLSVQGGGVLDAHPLPGHVWYAVTAADASGNESPSSTPVDINPGLLPVSQIAVVVDGDHPPQVSWTHPAAASIAGYNLYVNAAAAPFNAGLLTDTSFTDYGYAGDTRRYTLEADDGSARSQQRSLTLPALRCALDTTQIQRGLINRVTYTVENRSSDQVNDLQLHVSLACSAYTSTSFSLEPGDIAHPFVLVGGAQDVPDSVTLTTTLRSTPRAGERIDIIRSRKSRWKTAMK